MPKVAQSDLLDSILSSPEHYKMCLVCLAIVDRDSNICSCCYAYRFSEDSSDVHNRALDIAASKNSATGRLGRYQD